MQRIISFLNTNKKITSHGQKYLPWILVGLIVLTAGLVSLGLAKSDSLTFDESAHIPAGYSYVKYQDYRLNPEHPPLVKVLAGLPLLGGNFNFPTDNEAWQEDTNGQWAMGGEFLYNSGNNTDKITYLARLGPILLTLLLILAVYFCSLNLLGRWWALLPTAMTAFSPIVLAHGHYVTTDMGATLGILLAIYTMARFLEKPNQKNMWLAGLALGLAQIMKFSAVLLAPLFLGLVVIEAWLKTHHKLVTKERGRWKYLGRELRIQLVRLILVGLIAGAVIFVTYAIFNNNQPAEKQAHDMAVILGEFGQNSLIGQTVIGMANYPLTQPIAEYALGILMVIQRSEGGNAAYFMGEVANGGWWQYFPTVYGLKEALPILLLLGLALIIGLKTIVKKIIRKEWHWSEQIAANRVETAMLLFAGGYWLYSIRSPLNIGVRHILPTLPLIYIVAAGWLKEWGSIMKLKTDVFKYILNPKSLVQIILKQAAKLGVIMLLVVWLIIESLSSYPFYLPYYNQIAGGVDKGYLYATDSNYDWGQDLNRLKQFVEKKDIDKIAVDYFGGGSPANTLGETYVSWWSARNNPKEEGVKWLAVSINTLQGAVAPTVVELQRPREDQYLWLKTARGYAVDFSEAPEPDFRAGKSIFIYKL